MALTYLLSAMMLAAMFAGTDGNRPVSADLMKWVQHRCQTEPTVVFHHPEQCQLYFDCNDRRVPPRHSPFVQFLKECPYPQLFSTVTFTCRPFEDVDCGTRVEHVDRCQYVASACPSSHCQPCHYRHANCTGLPDGEHPFQSRLWTPHYAVCRSQRTVSEPLCPEHPVLQDFQIFHPTLLRCVSRYEIPREHGGAQPDCSQKADGLHPDDVRQRPDVYYECHGGQLTEVRFCQAGFSFRPEVGACTQDTEE